MVAKRKSDTGLEIGNHLPEGAIPSKCSVGVLGLGAVGMAAVRQLTNIPQVNKFYLFTSDPNKVTICTDDCGKNRHIDFLGRDVGQLNEELDNIDIMILAANKSPYHQIKLTREDELRYNLEIIKRAGYELKGFQGSVIVVTNPVDINAYLLSSWSDISPEYVTGLNHIDLARWRNIISRVFVSHVGDEFMEQLKVYTIGPHSPEMVAIFDSYGGLSQSEIAFLSKENMALLRQELLRYPLRQFQNGKSTGKATEDLAADSLREVVEAIIYRNNTVCQSTFMQPDELGLEGVLPGLFFGYPVRFDQLGRAILQPQTIDDMSDMSQITQAYHNLEGVILGLKKEGYIPKDVNRQGQIKTPNPTNTVAHVKSPPKHASPDYISLEARIIASADNRLYTWENPRNPNMRDELEMPFRIEALDLMNQNVENYLLMGKKGGISLSTLDGKQEEHFKCDPSESIRRMTQAEYDGKNYLIGGSHNTIYIYEPKKSNKPIEKIDNIPGLINNVSACGEWLAIAADRLYLHNLRNPSLSCEISSQELVDRDPSDAFISGRNVIVAAGSALLKYNIGNPLLCLDICNLEGTEINSITPTPHLGGTIFVATVDPQIYSVDSRTLDVNPKPFFKPGNNHNGTGRISYIEQAGFDYILATDKTNTMTPQNPGISLWNLCAPDVPRFFPIDCNHRIRGLVVIGSGDAK